MKMVLSRQRVTRAFAGFLVFMLACTAVSRGVYAYQMPQVTVAQAQAGVLSHEFEVEGNVRVRSERAVVSLAGLRVCQVYVEKGESVGRGDALFQVDIRELRGKISGLREAVKELEEKREQGRREADRGKKQQREQRRRNKKRQQEDMQELKKELKRQVDQAEKEYQAECDRVSKYPSFEERLEAEKKESSEYLSLRRAAEGKDATQADREELAIFLEAFVIQVKKEWEQGRESALEIKKSAEKALREARRNRRDTIRKQKMQNRRDNEDAEAAEGDEDAAGNTAMEELTKEIERKNKSLERYQKLYERDGKVFCDGEGIVREILVSVGESVPEGASVRYADLSGGLQFEAEISGEQRKYLNVGDTVKISLYGKHSTPEEVIVDEIRDKGDGSFLVRADMEKESAGWGETGKMVVPAESEPQDCYVPLSGLYAGGNDTFVLVLREQETFLGTEYHVEKRKVEVSDKNGEYAALKGSPVGSGERIVVSSDREVRPGDSVRMLEDADEQG